mmetsp:Transcript_9150/g.16498  ORF Transcript_9150/g.16498 Transcript_9150/m.16498 type:complete len:215 (-) Transcript_9150:1512-2156(-)
MACEVRVTHERDVMRPDWHGVGHGFRRVMWAVLQVQTVFAVPRKLLRFAQRLVEELGGASVEAVGHEQPGAFLLLLAGDVASEVGGAELEHGRVRVVLGAETEGSGVGIAVVVLVPEQLHPQQPKDEDDEEENEGKVGDGGERLEDGVDDLVELLPAARELEDPEEAEGAEDGEAGAPRAARVGHADLNDRHDDHQAVKHVHGVRHVLAHPKTR